MKKDLYYTDSDISKMNKNIINEFVKESVVMESESDDDYDDGFTYDDDYDDIDDCDCDEADFIEDDEIANDPDPAEEEDDYYDIGDDDECIDCEDDIDDPDPAEDEDDLYDIGDESADFFLYDYLGLEGTEGPDAEENSEGRKKIKKKDEEDDEESEDERLMHLYEDDEEDDKKSRSDTVKVNAFSTILNPVSDFEEYDADDYLDLFDGDI